MIRLEVTEEHSGANTTEYVAELLPELQRYNLKKMIKDGSIKLNGCLIKKDFELKDGDIIEVYMPLEFERVQLLDICYEDKNIIIVNKQPGMAVSAIPGSDAPDLMSMVINYMKDEGEYYEDGGHIPFPCHKLDIYTGGLVMYAKNGDIFDLLREALRQRRIKRIFQAIVKGCPEKEKGEFKNFYVKDGENKYRMSDRRIPGSVPIYTTYTVLQTNGEYSYLEIEPVTQIPNQERAHLEAAGFPILGDTVYGLPRLNKKLGIRYQALWATEILFATGKNNVLEYLNGKRIYTDDIGFPLVNI